jgi:hypothetical protein
MYCHGRLGGGGRLTVGSVGNSIPMGIELDYREKKMKTVYSSIGCNNRRQKAYCGKCIIVRVFVACEFGLFLLILFYFPSQCLSGILN